MLAGAPAASAESAAVTMCKAAKLGNKAAAVATCLRAFANHPRNDRDRLTELAGAFVDAGRADDYLAELDAAIAVDGRRSLFPLGMKAVMLRPSGRDVLVLDLVEEAIALADRPDALTQPHAASDRATLVNLAVEPRNRLREYGGRLAPIRQPGVCGILGGRTRGAIEQGDLAPARADVRASLERCRKSQVQVATALAKFKPDFAQHGSDCLAVRSKAVRQLCDEIGARLRDGPGNIDALLSLGSSPVTDAQVDQALAADRAAFAEKADENYNILLNRNNVERWADFVRRIVAAPMPSLDRECGALAVSPPATSDERKAYIDAQLRKDTSQPHNRYATCLRQYDWAGNPYKDDGSPIYPASALVTAARAHRGYADYRCSIRRTAGCIDDALYNRIAAILTDETVGKASRLWDAYRVEYRNSSVMLKGF